ncbi:MFS transporter [Lacticaseibacillus absianus]|uniref:MFS transporter n=1 Tax=Lacticaseibacillus absianus TaxID=2729623 RepID=UPI0015CBD09F|nr:MFS transporter [Lacticaseibacillus absianus]
MQLKRQLTAAYAYSFLAFFGITQLWVIYLGQRGLSLMQIGLCESIFHVASFGFEVPSGVLADRFTYRRMLALSRLAALAASAMMLATGGFWWFAVSFVLSAWSYNLQSGTLEALLYESLKQTGETGRWPRVTSRLNTVIELAASSGLLLGGAMVHWHFEWTYVIACGLAVLALGACLALQEPVAHRISEHQTIGRIVRTATQVLRHDRHLRRLMAYDAVFSAVSSTYYYYFQDVMVRRHFSGVVITALLLAASLTAIGVIQGSARVATWPRRRVAVGLLSVMAACLLLTAWGTSPVLAGVYLAVYALGALLPPVFTVYYNAAIPSAQRATLLSVASLLYSVVMIGLFPLVGWGIDRFGFTLTFTLIGVCFAASALALSVVKSRKGADA